jgi:hypothetical protein
LIDQWRRAEKPTLWTLTTEMTASGRMPRTIAKGVRSLHTRQPFEIYLFLSASPLVFAADPFSYLSGAAAGTTTKGILGHYQRLARRGAACATSI